MDTIRRRSARTHDSPFAPDIVTAIGEHRGRSGDFLEASIHQRLIACRQQFLHFFQRHLRRHEDVEDVLQDFCLKVIRGARTLRDGDRIDAWLHRVSRNTLIDHYRQRASWLRAEAAYSCEMESIVSGFLPQENEVSLCGCLHDAMRMLRPDYADILRRIDLEEQPREQVATELGLTANNVGVRLHRARRALRKKLEEICPVRREGAWSRCDHSQPPRPPCGSPQAAPLAAHGLPAP